MTRLATADCSQSAAEYVALIERLADHQPRNGFTHSDQLPALDDDDLGIVLAAQPAICADAFDDAKVAGLVETLRAPGLHMTLRSVRLGCALSLALVDIVRAYLLADVQEECDRREAERDPRLKHMTQQQIAAADCGVAQLS